MIFSPLYLLASLLIYHYAISHCHYFSDTIDNITLFIRFIVLYCQMAACLFIFHYAIINIAIRYWLFSHTFLRHIIDIISWYFITPRFIIFFHCIIILLQ